MYVCMYVCMYVYACISCCLCMCERLRTYLESVGHWSTPAELPTPPAARPFVMTTSRLNSGAQTKLLIC